MQYSTTDLMSQSLDVRSAAAAVDSLGSAAAAPPHALVKRSPLAHARGKAKSRSHKPRSHKPRRHGKKKCPKGKIYKKGKCQKKN